MLFSSQFGSRNRYSMFICKNWQFLVQWFLPILAIFDIYLSIERRLHLSKVANSGNLWYPSLYREDCTCRKVAILAIFDTHLSIVKTVLVQSCHFWQSLTCTRLSIESPKLPILAISHLSLYREEILSKVANSGSLICPKLPILAIWLVQSYHANSGNLWHFSLSTERRLHLS